MAYKRIKNKTYNNVMYLANLIRAEKGYPFGVAARIALDNFDNDGKFNYMTVGCLMNNLVTYKEHIARSAMHDFNMRDAY